MNDISTYRYLAKPLKKLAKVPQVRLGGVACFIIKNNSIVSSGMNHNPTGGPMEYEVDGKLMTRPEVIHAEVAAINAAAENNVDISGSALFMTMSPCINCAKAITKTPIEEVIYMYDWWDKAALQILHDAGIKTKKLKEDS